MKTESFHVNFDVDIRSALLKNIITPLAKRKCASVVCEFPVSNGYARVDIALIADILVGYEIKSDGDSLGRLPEQVRAYSQVFDRVYLVVGYRHAYAALQIIPEWWGVYLVHRGRNGRVVLEMARKARKNPDQDPLAVADLLWREEALALLRSSHKYSGYSSKPKLQILDTVVKELSLDQIRDFVCKSLLVRREMQFGSVST